MRAMRHIRWQALIAFLGMLLVGGMLAGQTRTKPDTPFTTPVPERGGIYTEALIGSPQRLNPLLEYANPTDRDINQLIFSGLTRFDAAGRPTPDLAYWLVAEDAVHYTFILKPGAQWHDGEAVTSADVAFTVGLLQNPDFPAAPELRKLWQAVEVEIGNAQIITFTLPEPFAPFLDYTTFGLLPAHLLEGVAPADIVEASFNFQPVGTGPFRFAQPIVENNVLTGVELTAFSGYYGTAPLLEAVHFRFYPSVAAALAGYEAGEVDGVSQVDTLNLPRALNMPELGLYSTVQPEYSLIYLNLTSDALPFFQEKRVRQALWRGINRQAIIAEVLQGQALPADSPIVFGSWAHNPNLPSIVYDPEAAAKLLDGAGWVFPAGALPGREDYIRQKSGVPLSFTLTLVDEPTMLAMAEAMQESWAKMGVRVTLNPVPAASLRTQYLEPRPRVFDAVLVNLSFVGTPDPDPYPFWHETQIESGQNYGGYNDRISSQYLEQARIAADMVTRARLYYNFQSRFTDQTPALLLFYPIYNYAVDLNVRGVTLGPLVEPSERLTNLPLWSVQQRIAVVTPAPTASPAP